MTIEKKYNPRCFFDVEIGEKPAGRVVFELFANICPITCENFRSLCTGECGVGKTTGKPLHYKGVKFHRVIKSFMIQGGDFSVGNGSGGESIYGGTFKDECFDMKHDHPYLLSMANRGKDTNGSQFFITTQPTPHLDGVHVVFGQVIKGDEVVREVENQPTDDNSCPLQPVVIANCGELVLKRKQKDKRHKKTASSAASSDAESSSPEKAGEKKHKKRHKHHSKKSKKEKHKRKEGSPEKEAQDDDGELFIIKPDEIPEIPANNFLMRRVPTEADSNFGAPDRRVGGGFYNRRPKVSRSGRKIKGRGFMRYRTPSPEGGRSGSETPPHWKQAQSRMKPLKEYLELAREDQQMDGEMEDAQPTDPAPKDSGKTRSSENTERRRDRKDRERDRNQDRERHRDRDRERDRNRDRNRDRESTRTSTRNHQDENHPPAETRRRRKFEENPRPHKDDRNQSPEGPRERSPRRSKEQKTSQRPGAAHWRGSGDGTLVEERESRTRAASGARRHDRETARDEQRKSPAKVPAAHVSEQAAHQRSKESSSSSGAASESINTASVEKAERRVAAPPTAKVPRRFEERSGDAEVPGVLRTRLPMTQLLDPAEPLPPGVEPDEITSCLDTANPFPPSQIKWGMSGSGGGGSGLKVPPSHSSSAESKPWRANSPQAKASQSRRSEAQTSAPPQHESSRSLAQKSTSHANPSVVAAANRTTSATKVAEHRESSSKSAQKAAASTTAPPKDMPGATTAAASSSSKTTGRESKRSRSQSRGRRRGHSHSPSTRKRNRSASSSSSSGGNRRKARARRDSSDADRSRGGKGRRGRRGRRRSSSSSSESSTSSSSSSSSGNRGRKKRRKGNARSGRRKRSSSTGSSSSD